MSGPLERVDNAALESNGDTVTLSILVLCYSGQ